MDKLLIVTVVICHLSRKLFNILHAYYIYYIYFGFFLFFILYKYKLFNKPRIEVVINFKNFYFDFVTFYSDFIVLSGVLSYTLFSSVCILYKLMTFKIRN